MANAYTCQAKRIPANDQDDEVKLARAPEIAESFARALRLFGTTTQDEQGRPDAPL